MQGNFCTNQSSHTFGNFPPVSSMIQILPYISNYCKSIFLYIVNVTSFDTICCGVTKYSKKVVFSAGRRKPLQNGCVKSCCTALGWAAPGRTATGRNRPGRAEPHRPPVPPHHAAALWRRTQSSRGTLPRGGICAVQLTAPVAGRSIMPPPAARRRPPTGSCFRRKWHSRAWGRLPARASPRPQDGRFAGWGCRSCPARCRRWCLKGAGR